MSGVVINTAFCPLTTFSRYQGSDVDSTAAVHGHSHILCRSPRGTWCSVSSAPQDRQGSPKFNMGTVFDRKFKSWVASVTHNTCSTRQLFCHIVFKASSCQNSSCSGVAHRHSGQPVFLHIMNSLQSVTTHFKILI